jgi:hypothetical protein
MKYIEKNCFRTISETALSIGKLTWSNCYIRPQNGTHYHLSTRSVKVEDINNIRDNKDTLFEIYLCECCGVCLYNTLK